MKNPNIVIIDYGIGNTYSVRNAIEFLGYKNLKISDNETIISNADALILPGVGAFKEAIQNLRTRKLDKLLDNEVLNKKKPILGICVGMQMLASMSEEDGIHNGLNWIPGKVKKLELPNNFAVPHVGWNDIRVSNNSMELFERTPDYSNFYFDHSYYFECDSKYVIAHCDYGIKVTAAVRYENIFGVQFHPEKSQTNGLKLFRSFFNSI